MVMYATCAGHGSPWWARCLNWLGTRLMGVVNAGSGYQVSRRLVWLEFGERWKTSLHILCRSSSVTVKFCRRLWLSRSGRQAILSCVDMWLKTVLETTKTLARCLCQALSSEALLLFRLLRDGDITVTIYQFSPVTVTVETEDGSEDASEKPRGFA